MNVQGWPPAGWVHGQGQADNGDVDRFRVAVQPGARYAVEFHVLDSAGPESGPSFGPTGVLSLQVPLEDGLGNDLRIDVPVDRAPSGRRMVFMTPADGSLDLSARFWPSWGDATVRYAIDLGPVPSDDHGDTKATATAMDARTVSGILDEPGDQDCFVVESVAPSGEVLWLVLPPGANRSARVVLSKDDGTYTATEIDRSTPFALRPGADGRVDVSVSWPAAGLGPPEPLSYALERHSGVDDHAGSAAQATPARVGEPEAFTIEGIGDVDALRFDLVAGHDYRVRLLRPGDATLLSSDGGVPELYALSSDGGTLAVDEDGYRLHAIDGGPCTLFVYGNDVAEGGRELARLLVEDVTPGPGGVIAFASGPGNPVQTWTDLPAGLPGEPRTLTGTVGRWEAQHFRLPVAAGERFLLTLAGGNHVAAYAVHEDRVEADALESASVWAWDGAAPVSRVIESARAGMLQISVQGTSWDDGVRNRSYELWLVPIVADDHADSQAAATLLPAGTRQWAHLDDADRDFLALDLVAGQRIELRAEAAAGAIAVLDLLHLPQLSFSGHASTPWGAAATLHVTPAWTGRHVLMVQGSGDVGISWRVVADDDHGDFPDTATELQPLLLVGQPDAPIVDLTGW